MTEHLSWADHLARSYHRKCQVLDVDDLLSAARMGLFQAATRFNSSRGLAFKTLAFRRIVGSLRDVHREYGRERGFRRSKSTRERPVRVEWPTTEEGTPLDFSVPPSNDEDEAHARHRASQLLALARNDRDRLLMWGLMEDRPLREIGNDLGVNESRVSQLLADFKAYVRARVSEG